MSSNRSIEETAAEYAAGVMHGRVATDFESNMRQNAETRLLLSDWETRIAEFIGVTANELIRSARKHNHEESERAWVAIAPEIFGQALHYDHQIGSMVYMVRRTDRQTILLVQLPYPPTSTLINYQFL